MSSLRSLPSCGLSLLRAPEDTFDYVLRVTTDDKHYARIHCHKAVLKAHSPRMRELMTADNYFQMEIKLSLGYMGAFIELIQYMYVRDITMISQKQKVLKLCAMFDMPLDIFLIRNDAIQPINTYRSVAFTIVNGPNTASTCITLLDFLAHIEFDGAEMVVAKDIPEGAANHVEIQTDPEIIYRNEIATQTEDVKEPVQEPMPQEEIPKELPKELSNEVPKKDPPQESPKEVPTDELLVYESDLDETYAPSARKKRRTTTTQRSRSSNRRSTRRQSSDASRRGRSSKIEEEEARRQKEHEALQQKRLKYLTECYSLQRSN